MSVMSFLPVARMSLLVTTWTGLALDAFGEAMRDPVMMISSTWIGALALAGGGVCAPAAAAKVSAAAPIVALASELTIGISGRGTAAARVPRITSPPSHLKNARAALIDVTPWFALPSTASR